MCTSIKAFCAVAGMEEECFVPLNGAELVSEALDLSFDDVKL
jgi:hypothetical protein